MSDAGYPVFPIFAFLGFVLPLIPLPWHLQTWNAGTCLYMIWASVGCLNQFVNSIVWHGNALNPAPIWCDISSRIIVAGSVAIPAASLCINRRLYKIATTKTVSITRSQKRRAVIEDLAIGVGIPLIVVGLHIVVNGHRFNIYGDIGCYPALVNVWLTYLLIASWPIGIGLFSASYCILSIRAFIKRNAMFNEVLATSSLSKSRYFRLMALATTELLCTIPFAAYSIYLNLTAYPVVPYRGWDDLHFDYGRVDQIPSTLWRLDHQVVVSLELSRWLIIVCSLVFFMFFGFASEARRNYLALFVSLRKRLPALPSWMHSRKSLKAFRLSSDSKSTSPSRTGALPVFIARPPVAAKRDSLGSFLTSFTSEEKARPPAYPSSSSFSSEKIDQYDECYGHAY